MLEPQELLQGMLSYQKHEYISALKHFTNCAQQHNNQLSQMIYQTLQAITNMQLCNYNQAAQQLNYLRTQLFHSNKYSNQDRDAAEIELVKVKVLANLLVIYLLNCNEQYEQILSELVQTVEDSYLRNKTTGSALFKALLKSLFGFESFQSLQKQLANALSQINKYDFKSKLNKQAKALVPSPIFYSSLSIYSHLSGNIEEAIRLQKASYQLSKNNNSIAAVISLRHLQEMQRELQNQRQRKYYHKQLLILMSSSELQGIAEQTLFRNYSLKIEAAHKVVQTLIQKEKELQEQQTQELLRIAVLWRLKKMKNGGNLQKIDTVLNLLSKDFSILNIMVQSQFIQQSIQEYRQKLSQFIRLAKRITQKNAYRIFFQKLSQVPVSSRVQKGSRVININILQEKDLEEYQQRRLLTPTRGKKHDFASSLSRKKDLNLRNQLGHKQQSESNHQLLHESQVSVKAPFNSSRNQQKNQVYLNEATEREKPIYKIGKDVKKGNKIEKGIVLKGQPKRQKSERSRSKDEGISRQKNTIDQFLKRPQAVSKKNAQEHLPLPIKEIKIQKKEQAQQSQHSEIQKRETQQKERNKRPQHKQIQKQQTNRSQAKELQPIFNKQSSRSQANKLIKIAQISSIPKNVPNKNNASQYNSFIPLGSSKVVEHKQQIRELQQKLQMKLRKCINLCVAGQYIIKRHFSSDGGAQRYFKLSQHKDKILWGPDEEHFDQSSYPIQDIKGMIYGKVTETMIKQANVKLQPWKCFSLIMKKRTFDVYCHEDRDLKFWLPGLSIYLKEINYSSERYKTKKISMNKVQKKAHNSIVFGDKVIPRFYSVGRALWKRFLLRMQAQHLKTKKKEKRNSYSCANAYAIVVGAVRLCNYRPQILRDIV